MSTPNPAATPAGSPPTDPAVGPLYVALTGNPNCGKTTVFNALTGLRAKVGNYAGVTVERKEGQLKNAPAATPITILDLPGTYSLSPKSLDEQISRDVLFHRLPDVPPPALVVVVVDASNLERNLYYATQVLELGYPTLVALNMMDVAAENGHEIDTAGLSTRLGVPVLPLVASAHEGIDALRTAILRTASTPAPNSAPPPAPATRNFCTLPPLFTRAVSDLAARLDNLFPHHRTATPPEALLLLTDDQALLSAGAHYPAEIRTAVEQARAQLTAAGIDWRTTAIEARYARLGEIHAATVHETAPAGPSLSDRIDGILTHKIWGLLIFVVLMALMFQSIFTFAKIPMDFLSAVVDRIGAFVGSLMAEGPLNDLLVNGVIKGVGAVVVFLPQILLLFLFISLLEDTGYMSRAAFLMDRLMSRVGLHGKSFIPMLSSFACAIPGIMATRTIESPKDRLVTILVAPLMSCSARLPVYTVLIAACIPDIRVLGFFKLTGLTMLAMYLLGIVVALLMAWLFKKTLLKGETPILIMELPPYKRPVLYVTLRHMWDRSKLFLRRAGTVILGINILLWALATYPKDPTLAEKSFRARNAVVQEAFPAITSTADLALKLAALQTPPPADSPAATNSVETAVREKLELIDREEQGAKLRHSFAGRLGRLIEPAIAPLGFDWKMGIGIVASFAAREVFVSTMSIVYNVGDFDKSDTATSSLAKELQAQRHPDGTPVYTTLVAVSLMVFYVFALQCVSTVAVVRRETNSWKWPLFQWAYMGALAWLLAFLTYQGGRLLGLG
ncbi:ferrous iron transport protein B [Verrucomicrobiota bacterium]|nr:ferrous iron transport protein B [Verrucomicrobiota bacterium]